MAERKDVRIPYPLFAGGINDAAADQGGMESEDLLDLLNAYFQHPSTASIIPGSYQGDEMTDDAGPEVALTSIPLVAWWEEQDKIIVLGHSTGQSKHYLFRLGPDGTGVERFAMPAAWNVATPQLCSYASWYGDLFYLCDINQALGLTVFDGFTTASVAAVLGGGPAGVLRPRAIFVHKNHLCLVGYGDEDVPLAPDLWRFSDIGTPSSFSPEGVLPIGESDEPLEGGISLVDYAFLYKKRRTYRIHGNGRLSFGARNVDNDYGFEGPRHFARFDGRVWGITHLGFAQHGPDGKIQLVVDRVLEAWAGVDNIDKAWVAVDPDLRQVLFGVHRAGDPGEYPVRVYGIDWRSQRITRRTYPENIMAASAIPQIVAAAPAGAPVLLAETNVLVTGWDANWTNADIRAGITTQHESQDQDTPSAPWVQDGAVAESVVTVSIVGATSGGAYKERVRHALNGLFSDYSAEGDIFLKCPVVAIVAAGITSEILNEEITADIDIPNSLGDFIEVESTDDDGVTWLPFPSEPIVVGTLSYRIVKPATEGCWRLRFKITRAGHPDGEWLETDNIGTGNNPPPGCAA